MKPVRLLLASSCLSVSSLVAADFIKLPNTNPLNTAESWQNASIPGSGDILVWNATFTTPGTAANMAQAGGDLQAEGIRVTNVGGTRNLGTSQVGFQNTASGNILTLGASGIDMSAATQALFIQTKLNLSASQTWNIANANTNTNPMTLSVGEDLAFVAAAANTTADLGGRTVTKTGLGLAGFSSGYQVSNGNFVVNEGTLHFQSGGSRVTTVAQDVAVTVNNGATLQIAVQSRPAAEPNAVVFNGAITLNAGGTLAYNNAQANPMSHTGTVTVAGNANLIVRPQLNGNNNASTLNFSGGLAGSANLAYSNTSASFLRFLGDNSAYSGTITLGGLTGNRSLRLQSDTAGSAAATWVVNAGNTLHLNGVSVQLGTLNGAGTVTGSNTSVGNTLNVGAGSFSGVISDGTSQPMALTKTGPGRLTLSGANTYTGATTVSAGTLQTTTAQSGTASVTVASGATFSLQVATPGTAFSTQTVSLGSTTPAILEIGIGATGNPAVAPLSTGTLNVEVPSKLRLSGGSLAVGTFPVVACPGAIGGQGLSALELVLPPRVNGSLAHETGVGLNVTITGIEQVRWEGAVNGLWDSDTVGDGSQGTANWRTTVTNAATRYLQTSAGSDTVTFDDQATGASPLTVTLNGTLTPGALTVNNSAKDYVFTGSGLVSTPAPLAKAGTGSLTLANTGVNSFGAGVNLSAGTLVLGDGATAGAGIVSGNATLDGTLVLNRPDDTTFALVPTGAGTLRKQQASNATITGAANLTGPIELAGGRLAFTAGGTLSGLISGEGQLEAAGGTLLLNGSVPNTHTGTTTVSAGTLQLSNLGGQSVGGDVTLTGGATLQILANEQIPDTATLRILGTSGDSLLGTTGTETVANVIVNPSAATGQLVMRNGFTVNNMATLNNGVLGAASSHTATLNALTMTGGTLRVAGGGGPSTLNIGPGGINASGGVIEVKFSTANNDATLNLGGDFTATASMAFNNANYAGANLNVINLLGNRNFNIADATVTTVAPDLGGDGMLTKTGGGTLVLNASCNAAHTGGTTVAAGQLTVLGTIGNVTVDGATAILSGNGTLGTVTATSGATISPGQAGTGRMTLAALTLADSTVVDCEAISNGNNDSLNVTGALTLRGVVKLGFTGGYTPALGASFDLFDAATVDATGFNVTSGLRLPALPPGLAWNTSAFTTTGILTVVSDNPYLTWQKLHFSTQELGDTTISGDAADPDNDGLSNALEYALGSLPRSATPATFRPVASLSAGNLRLTFRRSATPVSGVTYTFKVSEQANSGWNATNDYTLATQPNGDGTETVTVTFGPSAAPARFAQITLGF